jgi:hypothetical protein
VVLLPCARSEAAELRRGDRIEVSSGEVVEDSLIAVGEDVVIRGHVRGDAVAFAESVTVEGVVDGNLVTAASTVEIDGVVRGSVMTAGQQVKVGGEIGSQLYAAGSSLALDRALALRGDALLAGNEIEVAGMLARDVYATGDRVSVDGTLGRDLVMSGNVLSLGRGASVGRDMTATVAEVNDVTLAGVVLGATNVEVGEGQYTSRYEMVGYYIWKAMMIVAGLLVGALAISVAPGLFRAAQDREQWWRSTWMGTIGLFLIPFLALVAAVTLIGLPLAAVLVGGFLIALYIGKLVVAAELGRRILRLERGSTRNLMWGLLLGLVIITVLVSLPWVGELFRFIVAIFSIGTICNYAIGRGRQRQLEPGIGASRFEATSPPG